MSCQDEEQAAGAGGRGVRSRGMGAVPLWKRALDLAGVLILIPVVVPLGLAIGLLIKLVSRGPALFKQERVGYRGRPFTCYKFRSMVVNADAGVHQGHLRELMGSDKPMVKLDAHGDRRVIPGGMWLRSLGLDELPQLYNVWRGDMSLVGPRPCMAYECVDYTARHRRRFETLPGLTGYWQIKGKNRTTFEQMIDLDLYYVDHQSLLMDISIMVRTVPAILRQVIDLRWKKHRAARPPESRRGREPLPRRGVLAEPRRKKIVGDSLSITE